MSHKKVLIISYYFAPYNTSAVFRILRFSKYLPENGWLPYILTIKESKGMKNIDRELLDDINPLVRIYRTFTIDAQLLLTKLLKNFISEHNVSQDRQEGKSLPSLNLIKKIVSRLKRRGKNLRFFFFPDVQILWLPFALLKGYTLIKQEKIQVIFATGGPWTDFIIGYFLSLFTGKKLILDYRDLWTSHQIIGFPTLVHKKMAKRLEYVLLKKAFKVISVTEPITQEFIHKYPHLSEKFITITNGFADMPFSKKDSLEEKSSPVVQNKKFRLLYTGTFYLTHSPDMFLQGLHSLVTLYPEIRKEIEFTFIGEDDNTNIFHDSVIRWELSDIVITRGFLNYKTVHKEIQKYDAVVLIISSLQKEALTGKVFEYLIAQKPIIAVVPKDAVAAQLIRKTNAGIVADSHNIGEIKDALLTYFKQWKAGSIVYQRNEEELKHYDMQNLTKKLTAILDECVR